MADKTPSHRKTRAAPRQCVTTYITADGSTSEKKPAKPDSKSKTVKDEVNS